ncbi:helicase associated domain-containing protein [Streptomyces sp. NBC_00247]|uniref:helicase associated domain-containing protein n=1 Tax=Streptomyces sp. NBC_00247 TaxID=2975689 RepID=UPI002E27FB44|nr:helicase associated domain-containing protein [Streptomyces sp. NBC_00247]
MVWTVADAGFWRNLTAARTYHATTGTLAAPRATVVEGVAVRQWLANLRKSGGLGTDADRATERRRALDATDPDWCPPWPIDWQRHYAATRTLLAEKANPADIPPGVSVHDCDVGPGSPPNGSPTPGQR